MSAAPQLLRGRPPPRLAPMRTAVLGDPLSVPEQPLGYGVPAEMPDPADCVIHAYAEEDICWLEVPDTLPYRLGIVHTAQEGPIFLVRERYDNTDEPPTLAYNEIAGTRDEMVAIAGVILNSNRLIDRLAASVADTR